MRVRCYRDEDSTRLKEIYGKQCLPYEWPDIDHCEFVAKLVFVDDDDVPVAAALARKTVEIYGLFDPDWSTPAWRFEGLRMLHEAMRHKVGEMGYRDAHTWIPPQMIKNFGRKLRHLFGWKADPWQSYCRRTGY